jgi:CRP/FNR family transcriptional regulator, cyclic AMP receptor protein
MPEPTPSEKRRLVEGHALFRGLSQADLDELLVHARITNYRAGQEIFAKGSPGRSMMAILRGSIRVSAPSSGRREIVLSILHAGEVFGEIALLDGQDRTADATAITECELLTLDHRDFIPFLQHRADLCIVLLKVFCQRLRQADQQVEHAVFERLDSRVAKALKRLVNSTPQNAKAGSEISLRISQQELADLVGSTRESVNKQLHVWQKAGIVRLGMRLIVIPDIAVIEALA